MPTTPHPADHPPRDLAETTYDVVVLGGGSTGENVADYAHRGGLSVLVVEAELVGGDCSYWACMPSKALLRPVEVLAMARGLTGTAAAVTGELDVAAVLGRRDSFTSHYDDDGQVQWLEGAGLSLVRGTGRLVGERRVEVTGPDGGTVTVEARHAVVLCTGTAPAVPPVEGLADVGAWTSRDATSAQQAPRRLAVLGGGVVGVEMATAWRGLGSEQVTVLQRGERLLDAYPPQVGERVAGALRERGIDVRLRSAVTRAERTDDGSVRLTTDDGSTVEADEVLVAVGRRPRTQGLGLDVVGLADGYLDVDDSMRVTAVEGGWLYAAGDCTGRALLTHQGKYQARVCGEAVAARAAGDPEADRHAPWTRFSATADHRAVPQVVFSDPQVAMVGLTEQQARDRGLEVVTAEYELGSVAGAALLEDGYSGWAQLVVDAQRRTVVGATFLGRDVAELLHSATIAVVGEVPLDRLWHAVPSYPTVSEVWLRLLDQLPRG